VIYAIFTFNSVLWLIWWLLIVSMCFTVYRAIRLPALLWIGVYYAVSIVAVPVMQYYGHRIEQSGHLPALTSSGRFPSNFVHSPLALATLAAATLDYAGDILVLILAFSEAAVLLRRVYPDVRSTLLRVLAAAHVHIRALGIAAIVVTALLPVPMMAYFYTHS
jgi:hypothetical protein